MKSKHIGVQIEGTTRGGGGIIEEIIGGLEQYKKESFTTTYMELKAMV